MQDRCAEFLASWRQMRLESPQRPSYPGGAEVWVDDITSRADVEQASGARSPTPPEAG